MSTPILFARIIACVAAGVALVGASGLANAQFSSSSDPQTAQAAQSGPAAQTSPNATGNGVDFSGERGLPAIVTPRPDSRAVQLQDQAQQASRLRSSQLGMSLREVKRDPASFSNYVEISTGAQLHLFGGNLFTDVPSTFAPFDAAQVNGDYVIGSGDEVQIRGWGMINIELTTVVDRSGSIYIPRVGAVKVAGVKYRDLQGVLKQAVGKIFSNFELSASISQTRALQIYVVGQAVRPGTYTLNSMSTLLNALFSSGGPSATGSMRNIQLKRGSATVATFDLYDMLLRGDKTQDASLRDGDVIYIPEIGPLVALTGDVKTPAIFEMKGTTSVAEVLAWAGGVDSPAEQKRIVVEKAVNNAYQSVADVVADKDVLQKSLSVVPVNPADVIRIFSPSAVAVQTQLQREYVRVAGEVKKSGVFQINKGETVRELMTRIGGLTDEGYLYATQLKRESVRRTQQAKLDEVANRFESDIERGATSRVAGSTDRDAVAIAATEVERQRDLARRMRTVKAEGRIVLEFGDATAQLKNIPDLPLQDGDSIFVPRKPGTVEVLGAVFQPNSFIYKPRRTVSDYVALAGGNTDSADKSELYVIRADGTARSARSAGWFSGLGGVEVNPGDVIVVPERIDRSSWRQSLKEWTAIFYQFGLGAAGLKVLKN